MVCMADDCTTTSYASTCTGEEQNCHFLPSLQIKATTTGVSKGRSTVSLSSQVQHACSMHKTDSIIASNHHSAPPRPTCQRHVTESRWTPTKWP